MDHTYRLTEIVGTSDEGLDSAIQNALKRASRTLRQLDWFQVSEIRGWIQEGGVGAYQVTLKVGFRLDDDEEI